jgi:hypothetical protein
VDSTERDPAAQDQQPSTGLIWLAAGAILIIFVAAALLVQNWPGGGGAGADISLEIVSPESGATVSAPFDLEVESSGVQIAPPEEGVPGAAHYHAFLDVHPFTPGGQVIPQRPDVLHFAGDTVTLDLPPGEHSIIVALGDNDDVRLGNAAVADITITVVE